MPNLEREPAGRFAWSSCAEHMRPSDLANMRRTTIWMITWTLSFAVATVLLALHVVKALPLTIAVATAPTLLGIGVIRSFLRFLREADELMRKVQMEAIGWGFGAGLVFMLGYRLFERIGAPHLDIVAPFVVMLFATAIGQFVAWRRYL